MEVFFPKVQAAALDFSLSFSRREAFLLGWREELKEVGAHSSRDW